MSERTVTFDDEQWQLVPRKATNQMVMDLRPRAADLVKIIRKDGGKCIEFSCDFGLVYRLMLGSAPVMPECVRDKVGAG